MRCTRCGCAADEPCVGSCAWALPDLCSACLTLDETRLAAQYSDRLDELRAQVLENVGERRLIAILNGVLANPMNATAEPEALITRAAVIAHALRHALDGTPLV